MPFTEFRFANGHLTISTGNDNTVLKQQSVPIGVSKGVELGVELYVALC